MHVYLATFYQISHEVYNLRLSSITSYVPVVSLVTDEKAPSYKQRYSLLSVNQSVILRKTGLLSNLSAMGHRINLIPGVAGHYAMSAAVKAMFECEL